VTTDDAHGKQLAAERALDDVKPGMRLGLGTGSTARRFVAALGARVAAGLEVTVVATSCETREQAQALGIPLVGVDDVDALDLYVDGADEVDPTLRLVKGGGGALLHEKIVASLARRFLVIVDASKLVPVLGAFPLPVEVVRFGWPAVARRIVALGGQPTLRRGPGGEAFVTEEQHHILDCRFGQIAGPEALARALDATVGVVEHGLFLDMADRVIIGGTQGVRELFR